MTYGKFQTSQIYLCETDTPASLRQRPCLRAASGLGRKGGQGEAGCGVATWLFQWVDVAVRKKRARWPLEGLGCLAFSLRVRLETLVGHRLSSLWVTNAWLILPREGSPKTQSLSLLPVFITAGDLSLATQDIYKFDSTNVCPSPAKVPPGTTD